jgi:PAS domain-containing protein
MGLLLQTPHNLAPRSSDPFVVTDGQMRLRAVSELAERLLGVSEVEAVERSLDEFLVPAATSPAAAARLRATLCEVAVSPYGSHSPAAAVLQPRDTYGVRHGVRIAPCEPGPAALIVFEEAL